MSEYNFVRNSPNHYKYIKELYKSSFNLDQSLAQIEKKYDTSNFKLSDSGFFAFKEKEVAAYYGIFPITAIFNNKDYLVAQSGDTMTAPNHRKKGLFTQLAKHTYQFAKENKVEFVYGFPNQNSLPGFSRKLDWVFQGCFQNFNFKIDVFPFSELEIKSKLFKPAYDFYLKRKLSKYKISFHKNKDGLPAFKNPFHYGWIKKDIHFFNYKSGHRRYLIKYKGFTLFIKVNVNLQIGDVEFFDKNKTDDFIEAIQSLGKEIGCRGAMLAVSPNHWLCDYLKGKIKPEDGLPIGGINLNNSISIEDFVFTFADHDIF